MNLRFVRLFVASLALVSLLACPVNAQDQKDPNEIGHLYLGNGLSLSALKPRLLTANANVTEFLYSPTGARIAYTTQRTPDNESDTSLAVVATQSGETKVYLTGTMVTSGHDSRMAPESLQIEGLDGWSDDAHYLAFIVMRPYDLQGSDNSLIFDQVGYVDLVQGTVNYVSFPAETLVVPPADPNAPTPAAIPDQGEPGKLQFAAMNQAVWAPSQNVLGFIAVAVFNARGIARSLCLFDPSRQTTKVLLSATKYLRLMGWLDNQHLEYAIGKDSFVYDLEDGKSEPMTKTAAVVRQPSQFREQLLTSVPAEDKQTIAISAASQPVTAQTQTYGNATAIWIQRQAGPPGRNRVLVDVFRGPLTSGWNAGSDSNPQFAPNAGFDRQGRYQVAYLAQGDLKVCDLSVRDASLLERALGGEKLPCNQQEMLALENAKQMGLAILEYTQDFDEHFPKADGFNDSIAPYLQPDFPIDLPNIAPFHYIEPQNLALGNNDNPADTPIGTYTLPCGTATVYMDGHARVNQNPPADGG